MVIKKDLKVLRYVYRHHSVRMNALDNRFPGRVKKLVERGFITYAHGTRRDDDGFPVEEYSPDAPCWLTETGLTEVEAREWFDAQFVITMIVVPIVVGVLSSILTNLILHVI